MGFSGRDVAKEGFANRVAEKFIIKTYLDQNRFPCFDGDLQPIQQFHDGTPAGRLTHLIDTVLMPVWPLGDSDAFRVRSQLLTVLADELGVKVKVPTSLDNNRFDLRQVIEGYLAKMDFAIA